MSPRSTSLFIAKVTAKGTDGQLKERMPRGRRRKKGQTGEPQSWGKISVFLFIYVYIYYLLIVSPSTISYMYIAYSILLLSTVIFLLCVLPRFLLC